MTDLESSQLLNTTTPSVNLTWNNQFDSVPPFLFSLSVMGTQLSSDEMVSFNLSLNLSTLGDESGSKDYSYTLASLLFYTAYEFKLVALYDITGSVFSSMPVTVDYTTEEGGM